MPQAGEDLGRLKASKINSRKNEAVLTGQPSNFLFRICDYTVNER